jgi:hypothetical protein
MIAATSARTLSKALTVGAPAMATGAGREAGTAAGAGRGAAAAAGAAAPTRGAGAAGAAAPKLGAGAVVPGPPVGPPGGRVGSLIVGAAEGLGGKLIRTVSFFGWTLPVSFFGGTAPVGIFGMFSAITSKFLIQAKGGAQECQTHIQQDQQEPTEKNRDMNTRPVRSWAAATERH